MASTWKMISENRRRMPRYKESLAASVSIIEAGAEGSQWPTVLAYTRDVSQGGIGLILPSSRIGCHDLNKGDYILHVVLAVPIGGSVKMQGRLIYCRSFDEIKCGVGCLVGIEVTGVSPCDLSAYHDFIDSLSSGS